MLPSMLFAVAAWFDYRAERRDVHNQVLATSNALTEHAQKVVETADLVLARAADQLAGLDWPSIRTSRALHDTLVQMGRDLPQIASIFLVDPDGITAAVSTMFPLRSPSNELDRLYFRQARDGDGSLIVGTPLVTKLFNRPAFTITRRLERNGVFNGVVGVTIPPAYFYDFYSHVVDYPGHSIATLLRSDGVVLVRYPTPEPAVLRMPPSSQIMRAIERSNQAGEFTGRSALDGLFRLDAYHRLASFPLYINYSVDSAAYLIGWYWNLLFIGICSAVLAATLLLTEQAMKKRTRAEIEASRRLTVETDRRQDAELALEQLQKMEALGRLTGGVAHDFNNLLTAIMGSLELAIKRNAEPRVARLLESALQAARRGARLTAQMLAVARKREVMARPLDPNEVIRDMGDLIGRTIGPMIHITSALDPAATPISADIVQFEVTLLNLCVNARDAMPEGGELTIRTDQLTLMEAPSYAPELPPGRYICISVTDNGEGMTDTVRARALEPFFTTKEPGKGTGLGLSAAYGFARAASGAVTIESTLGQGTVVTLILPRVAGTPAPDASVAASRPLNRALRILLVDDDPWVRLATREVLEDIGHEVVDADGAAEALQTLAQDTAFDLVATDFAMPEMNGSQLATAIRIVLPDMPILFVTGYARDGGLGEWTEQNTQTLNKPFSTAELARAVEAAVSPA